MSFDPPQVDYRNEPSYGGRYEDIHMATYDEPFSAAAHPVSPPTNAQHQQTPEKSALELEQPQLAGFSPDLQAQLRWERERRGFG